jgi:hypothetical protein
VAFFNAVYTTFVPSSPSLFYDETVSVAADAGIIFLDKRWAIMPGNKNLQNKSKFYERQQS